MLDDFHGFAQKNFVALGLDLIDFAVLEWFIRFQCSGKMKVLDTTETETYYWVSYTKILEDLPIIGITQNEVMRRRFKRYENLGLMDKRVLEGKKVYFKCNREKIESILGKSGLLTLPKQDDSPTAKYPSCPSPHFESGGAPQLESGQIKKYIDKELKVKTIADCKTSATVPPCVGRVRKPEKVSEPKHQPVVGQLVSFWRTKLSGIDKSDLCEVSNGKDFRLMKDMLTVFKGDAAKLKEFFNYVLEHWEELRTKYRIDSITPTLGIVYGFRQSFYGKMLGGAAEDWKRGSWDETYEDLTDTWGKGAKSDRELAAV